LDLAGESRLRADANPVGHGRLIVDSDVGRLVRGKDIGLSLLNASLRYGFSIDVKRRLAPLPTPPPSYANSSVTVAGPAGSACGAAIVYRDKAVQRDAAVHARAAHWRRYDLDRLPDDPQFWARAAEILRQLPEARVGVGPKPITAAEAAEQAEQKATR
jgi:hypothetical protein